MKLRKKLFLFLVLFIFSSTFAGEDRLNAIMHDVSQKLNRLESVYHVQIGLTAIDTYNNTHINFNADKRFPMNSTFKLMAVSAVLKKSEQDANLMQRRVFFTKEYVKKTLYTTKIFVGIRNVQKPSVSEGADQPRLRYCSVSDHPASQQKFMSCTEVKKSGYAPITKQHIKTGMTVSDLCGAALIYSDSVAANLLMQIVGGPNGVTQFARSIGDKQFLLVRWEPELNSAIPNDHRDTTTPSAMADSVQKLVLGNALGNVQRIQLQHWLKQSKTGDHRIRAGVSKKFIVADKTGGGGYGSIGDIGVVWRPHQSPVVLAIYVKTNEKDAHTPDRVIAEATKIAMSGMIH